MATTTVEHTGTVQHEHRHRHHHTHVIVNEEPGRAEADRGGDSPSGLRAAAREFHSTERGGDTPRD